MLLLVLLLMMVGVVGIEEEEDRWCIPSRLKMQLLG